jgi:O-antigen ligase
LPEAIKAKTVGGSFALEILSLGHPNHTATYLLMMIVLALAYLNYRRYLKEGLWPWLYLVGAVLLIPSLILTFSRSAGLTFVLLILVFGAALGRRKLVGGLIALALVGVISASTVPSISRYFTDATHPFSTGAIADRIHVWKGILRLVNDQPFLGVGPRNFNYFDKSRYGIDLSLGYFNHAHSLYFNVLAELGWMGLASLILWLGAGAFVVWRSKRRLASPWGRVVWLGALGCLFAFTISGIMTTTFHTEGAMAFSAVLAIALAAREFDQSEEEALYGGA